MGSFLIEESGVFLDHPRQMPTMKNYKECVLLNNVKSLFPEPGTTGEKNKAETVTMGKQRPLDLSTEDDKLLAEQRILYNQISMAAS
jgi:hypothetical protein